MSARRVCATLARLERVHLAGHAVRHLPGRACARIEQRAIHDLAGRLHVTCDVARCNAAAARTDRRGAVDAPRCGCSASRRLRVPLLRGPFGSRRAARTPESSCFRCARPQGKSLRALTPPPLLRHLLLPSSVRSSSVVEQAAVNRRVGGSIPSSGANRLVHQVPPFLVNSAGVRRSRCQKAQHSQGSARTRRAWCGRRVRVSARQPRVESRSTAQIAFSDWASGDRTSQTG